MQQYLKIQNASDIYPQKLGYAIAKNLIIATL